MNNFFFEGEGNLILHNQMRLYNFIYLLMWINYFERLTKILFITLHATES